MQRVSGLRSHSADDVFEHFAHYTDGSGCLSETSFGDAFSLFVPTDLRSDRELVAVSLLRGRLFQLFKGAEEESVEYTAAMCGLSLLCGGDPTAKAAAVFELLSLDDDGTVTFDDLVGVSACVCSVPSLLCPYSVMSTGNGAGSSCACAREPMPACCSFSYTGCFLICTQVLYLTSVAAVVYEADPTLQAALQASADSLALGVAQELYDDSGLLETDSITLKVHSVYFTTVVLT